MNGNAVVAECSAACADAEVAAQAQVETLDTTAGLALQIEARIMAGHHLQRAVHRSHGIVAIQWIDLSCGGIQHAFAQYTGEHYPHGAFLCRAACRG